MQAPTSPVGKIGFDNAMIYLIHPESLLVDNSFVLQSPELSDDQLTEQSRQFQLRCVSYVVRPTPLPLSALRSQQNGHCHPLLESTID
jgi:hypothetical protein